MKSISEKWNMFKERKVDYFTDGMMNILGAIVIISVGATLFVALMPAIFDNLSDSSIWTGTTGTLITSIFGIVIAISFLTLFINAGKGK